MKTVILAVVGLAFLAGCGSEHPAPPTGKSGPVAGAQTNPEIEKVLTYYEKVRALLAEDKTEGLSELAGALHTAAEQAGSKASDAARLHLREIATAAAKLKEEGGHDLAKARRAFGEASRHVIGLVSAEPSLVQGRRVFLCPMTKDTYNKWVQTSPDVSNPYMGKKMSGCGADSEWRE